jgi:hypothetical protein
MVAREREVGEVDGVLVVVQGVPLKALSMEVVRVVCRVPQEQVSWLHYRPEGLATPAQHRHVTAVLMRSCKP